MIAFLFSAFLGIVFLFLSYFLRALFSFSLACYPILLADDRLQSMEEKKSIFAKWKLSADEAPECFFPPMRTETRDDVKYLGRAFPIDC